MPDDRARKPPTSRRRGAVAIVVRRQRFLVIERSAQVVAPGALCFPGGGIETGETEAQALVREFREELGAEIAPLARVWQSTTAWHTELAWWLGDLAAGARLVPNPAEVAAYQWMTADELRGAERLLASNREFLAALDEGRITLDPLAGDHRP